MVIRMGNPLYNEQMQNSFSSQLNSFMANPMGFLIQHDINIPQQYANTFPEYLIFRMKSHQCQAAHPFLGMCINTPICDMQLHENHLLPLHSLCQ